MKLSVILISYNMPREIPRTLQSLSRNYQLGADRIDYEVILVDNGSTYPVDQDKIGELDVPLRYIFIDDADPSSRGGNQ